MVMCKKTATNGKIISRPDGEITYVCLRRKPLSNKVSIYPSKMPYSPFTEIQLNRTGWDTFVGQ